MQEPPRAAPDRRGGYLQRLKAGHDGAESREEPTQQSNMEHGRVVIEDPSSVPPPLGTDRNRIWLGDEERKVREAIGIRNGFEMVFPFSVESESRARELSEHATAAGGGRRDKVRTELQWTWLCHLPIEVLGHGSLQGYNIPPEER